MSRYTPTSNTEFKARQQALNFGVLVQRVIYDSRASLKANLDRIKKSWSSWFPKKIDFPLCPDFFASSTTDRQLSTEAFPT